MIKSLFKKPEKVPDSVEGLKIKLSPAVSGYRCCRVPILSVNITTQEQVPIAVFKFNVHATIHNFPKFKFMFASRAKDSPEAQASHPSVGVFLAVFGRRGSKETRAGKL
jgi:hypothetical protein